MENRYLWIIHSASSGGLVFVTHSWMKRGQMSSEVYSKPLGACVASPSSHGQGLWWRELHSCSGVGGQCPERFIK